MKNVTKKGVWNFDVDGDGQLDKCSIDQCRTFGGLGDLPIVGDWKGTGKEVIGLFRPRSGTWYLDLNGNGRWDGSPTDALPGPFGCLGDIPVVGDWDGTGKIRIGVYRPSNSGWYLDITGDGKWQDCNVDGCLGPFGQKGDLPVVGKWYAPLRCEASQRQLREEHGRPCSSRFLAITQGGLENPSSIRRHAVKQVFKTFALVYAHWLERFTGVAHDRVAAQGG